MKTNVTTGQFVPASRRRFLASTAVAAAGVWFLPRRVLAAGESPVTIIRRAAATARITVTKLRGNVSVLEGSRGNIAVLTGRYVIDGKTFATQVYAGV